MDRFYVDMSSIANLTDQGFVQFKLIIFGQMAQKITQAVLSQVKKERDGEPVDSDLLKSIVSIYSYLSNEKIINQGVDCLLDLENKLVNESIEFFKIRSAQMIQSATLLDYLNLTDELLNSENARAEQYLTWDSVKSRIRQAFMDEILVKNQ